MDFFNFSDPKEIGIMILVALLIVLFVVWVMRSNPEEQPRSAQGSRPQALGSHDPFGKEPEGVAFKGGELVDAKLQETGASFQYQGLVYTEIPINLDREFFSSNVGHTFRAKIVLQGREFSLEPVKADIPEGKVRIEEPIKDRPGYYKALLSQDGYFRVMQANGDERLFVPGQILNVVMGLCDFIYVEEDEPRVPVTLCTRIASNRFLCSFTHRTVEYNGIPLEVPENSTYAEGDEVVCVVRLIGDKVSLKPA